MVRRPPTRSNCRSWMARRSFTWAATGSSPTSSRKRVPPSASSKRPGREAAAPVKAPRSWPKSSLSRRASGSAAQFTGTKGRPARGPSSWMARATTSLPVPLSPRRRTVARLWATRSTTSSTRRHAELPPTAAGEPLASGEERGRVGAGAGQGVLGAVQPHPGGDHRGGGGEDAHVGVEGEGAGGPVALGGQYTQGGADLAEGNRVEGPRVALHVPPAPGAVQEGGLGGEVGDGHREAGLEDAPHDPLPRTQAPQDPLLVGDLRRRLDEHLAGHRVEERDGPVLEPEVRAQDLEDGREGLGEIGGQGQHLADVVQRLDGDGGSPGVHGGRWSKCDANPRSTGLASGRALGPIRRGSRGSPARFPGGPARGLPVAAGRDGA